MPYNNGLSNFPVCANAVSAAIFPKEYAATQFFASSFSAYHRKSLKLLTFCKELLFINLLALVNDFA